MANLTGQNIKDTYQQLVTLGSGTTITNGTGSQITNLAVTASWASNAVTASYALNAGVTVNTGSLMVTGSVSGNVLTFTKGDGSAFNLTVATGSGGGATVDTGSLLNNASAVSNVLTFTRGNGTTFNVTVATGSATTVNTGSLMVTASAAGNVITFTKGDASTFNITVATGSAVSASYADYAANAGQLGGQLPAYYATATSVSSLSSSLSTRLTTDESNITTLQGQVSSLTAATSSYALKTEVSGAFASTSASFATRLTTDESTIATNTANIASLTAATSSYAKTNVNNNFSGTQTFNNIAVNGTASIAYLQAVTGSAKIIGDAYIILNNDTPAERYAGVKVIDSGSANTTGSFLFDGLYNNWFYAYGAGDGTDHAVALFGPEYSDIGTPAYPAANVIQKGTGGHHLTGSALSDDGVKVTVATSLESIGNINSLASIIAGTGFTGSLNGNADTATSASYAATASYVDLGTSAVAGFTGSVWTFNHNLNKDYVIVDCYDSNNEEMIPQSIDLVTSNQAVISFPVSVQGTAVASLGNGVTIGNITNVTQSITQNVTQSVTEYYNTSPINTVSYNIGTTNTGYVQKIDLTLAATTYELHVSQSGPYLVDCTTLASGIANLNIYMWVDAYTTANSGSTVVFMAESGSSTFCSYRTIMTGSGEYWSTATTAPGTTTTNLSRNASRATRHFASSPNPTAIVKAADGTLMVGNPGTLANIITLYKYVGNSGTPIV